MKQNFSKEKIIRKKNEINVIKMMKTDSDTITSCSNDKKFQKTAIIIGIELNGLN